MERLRQGDIRALRTLHARHRRRIYQLAFAFAQMDNDTALDKLIAIAKSDDDPEMRKSAVFWLGQTDNPKARQALLDIIGIQPDRQPSDGR